MRQSNYYKVRGKNIFIKNFNTNYWFYSEIEYLDDLDIFKEYIESYYVIRKILTIPNYKNFINNIFTLINARSDFEVHDFEDGYFNCLKESQVYFSLERTENCATLIFIIYKEDKVKNKKVGVTKVSDIKETLSLFKV